MPGQGRRGGGRAAAVDGDSLGFVFVDMKALVEATTELAASAAPSASVTPFAASVTKSSRLGVGARPRGRRRLPSRQCRAAQGKCPGPDENRTNAVAGWAPPSTTAMIAGNDYGATLTETIELCENDPALKDAYAQVEQMAAMLGGIDGIVGWMGDTGIVVDRNGDPAEGGLISVPADAARRSSS